MNAFKLKLLLLSISICTIFGCSTSGDNPTESNIEDDPNDWSIETINSGGEYPSLAIDTDGMPHISYLDYTDGYVKYATPNGDTWTVASVGKVSNSNGTIANGGISSIALDALNNPHITYYDYGNVQFKYAYKNGTNWIILYIPLPNDPLMSYDSPFIPWEESSVIVNKQTGMTHVSLQMSGGLSGSVLGYWRSGMSEAVIVDGDDANSGYHNAIALDGNGRPGISYEARGSGELKYAYWSGMAFEIETIAPMPLVYWMERITSIAMDSNNMPHIAYYGQGVYKYAHKNGASWTIKDMTYQSGYPALSLSLDNNGLPHIALVAIDTGNSYRLKHAFLNDSQWAFENIEDNINHCAIALDSAGQIHVVYETDSGELKYATR